MTTIPSISGALLLANRLAKGLSQEKLAGDAGVHTATVRRAENDVIGSGPSTSTIIDLADALDIHPASLFDREEWAAFLAFHEAAPRTARAGAEPDREPEKDQAPGPQAIVPDADVLAHYELTPRIFAGKKFHFEFVNNGKWGKTDASTAECLSAFGLRSGECVELGGWPRALINAPGESQPIGEVAKVYASGEIAQTVLEAKASARIEVVACAVYGVLAAERWTSDESTHHVDEFTGFSVEQVLGVTS